MKRDLRGKIKHLNQKRKVYFHSNMNVKIKEKASKSIIQKIQKQV